MHLLESGIQLCSKDKEERVLGVLLAERKVGDIAIRISLCNIR